MTRVLRFIVVPMFSVLAGVANAGASTQGPPPDYDFQWATITDVNNPAYGGGPFGQLEGRGSVGYEYRISKLEVTSAQWLEFINIFAPQAPNPGSFLRPSFSGIQAVPGGQAGTYQFFPNLPNAGMVPVFGITWHEAAMYCNWLHNGKSREWSAIQDGAYDVSTFGLDPNGGYSDQRTHSPDAQFWIPTLDEWIKAAHYDPNRSGIGQPGWWEYPYGSDNPPVAGVPGVGQTSAGVTDPIGFATVLDIPLGSYPDADSPWGLLDVSGGVREYTEETNTGPLLFDRIVKGAYAGATGFSLELDRVYNLDYQSPVFTAFGGLRVASTVPAPFSVVVFALCLVKSRRRRQTR